MKPNGPPQIICMRKARWMTLQKSVHLLFFPMKGVRFINSPSQDNPAYPD